MSFEDHYYTTKDRHGYISWYRKEDDELIAVTDSPFKIPIGISVFMEAERIHKQDMREAARRQAIRDAALRPEDV